MCDKIEIPIERIRTLDIRSNEVLLIEVPYAVSQKQLAAARRAFRKALPENDTIIYTKGSLLDIKIVNRELLDEKTDNVAKDRPLN